MGAPEGERAVPMKILVLGMSRTGTSSLREALIQLGYKDVYHMSSVLRGKPTDADMWIQAYEAKFEGKGKPYGRKEFDQLLGNCMAVSDFPVVSFSEELLEAYPEAKVILSVRDSVEAWHKSVLNTIWPLVQTHHLPHPNPLVQFYRSLLPRPRFLDMLSKGWSTNHYDEFPTRGKQTYLEHNEKIRKLAGGSDRLLEFNVKEGWSPLVNFLGPEDVKKWESGQLGSFPNVNDTKAFKRNVKLVRILQNLKLFANVLLGAGGLAAVVYGLYLAKIIS